MDGPKASKSNVFLKESHYKLPFHLSETTKSTSKSRSRLYLVNSCYRLPQIPRFLSTRTKSSKWNQRPFQGRRINRLPCISYVPIYTVCIYICIYTHVYHFFRGTAAASWAKYGSFMIILLLLKLGAQLQLGLIVRRHRVEQSAAV
jgi:hypothetical protein